MKRTTIRKSWITGGKYRYFVFALITCACTILYISPTQAITIEEKLANPAMEQRAHEVFKALRCISCQGESIADSRADLARDLRRTVRDKITSGYTDGEILDYISAGYGDSVLMQPPLKLATYLLWFGPPVLLFFSFILVFLYSRKKYTPFR